MRIEDASLHELTDLFIEKIRTEWLPPGSVILLGSASYLSRVGVSAYLEDYVKTVQILEERIRNATVAHAPLLLLNGSADPALIRALFELSNWLMAVEGEKGEAGADLSAIISLWTEMLHSSNNGELQPNYQIRLAMPKSREMPIVKKIWVSEPENLLPASTAPISQVDEGEFLDKFIGLLNRTLNLNLSNAIQTERIRIRRPYTYGKAEQGESKHTILVGDRSATDLYEEMQRSNKPATLIKVDSLDHTTVKHEARRIRETIETIKPNGAEMLAIFCLLEQQYFLDEEGRPGFPDIEDYIHIRGNVHLARLNEFKPEVRKVIPLIEAASEIPKIVLAPLPRFANGPCCQNRGHALNTSSGDFVNGLRDGLGQAWRTIKDVLDTTVNTGRFRVLNAAATLLDVPREVAWDQSKITMAGTKALLEQILSEAESIRGKRTVNPMMGDEKRRRSGPEASEQTTSSSWRHRHASEGARRYPDTDYYDYEERHRHRSDNPRPRAREWGSPDRYRYRY